MRSGPRLHVVLASVVVLGLIGGGVGVPRVAADEVDQQRQRVENIADDLENLENRIGELDEQHAAALDRIDELTVEIQASQTKVDAQTATLSLLQVQMSTIALDKFMSGGSIGATPLLGSAVSVTEELQRGELSRVALDQGAGTTDEMESLVDDLTAETNTLQARKSEQAELISSLESQQTQGEALVTEYEDQYAAAKVELGNLVVEEQERRAAAAIAEAQQREAQKQAQERARQAQAQAQQAAQASNSGGTASSPARGGGVTATPPAQTGGDDDTSGDTGDDSGSGSGSVTTAPVVDTPVATVPQPSSLSGIAVNAASGQLGVAYKFAAESPGVAFDCSGLTKFAWGKAGVYLPHQSASQYASTPHVPKDQAQPGDLIFYYSPIGHVGIYIGGGSMIHAPAPGKTVMVATVNWSKVVGVSRPG
jgi:cell wall-associated NlpC family hydrolase